MKWKMIKDRIMAVALAAAVASTSLGGMTVYAEGSQNALAAVNEVSARDGAFAFNTRVNGELSSQEEDVYVIHTPENADWFYRLSFTNASNFKMSIMLSEDSSFAGECIMHEEIWGKEGQDIDLAKRLEAGKTYYFQVKCVSLDFSQPSNYYFQISTAEDDVKDTFEESEKVALNQKVVRKMQNKSDEDFFQFTTTSNPDTFYNLEFTNAGTEGRMYFIIYEDALFVDKFEEITVWNGESQVQNLVKLLPNHTYYVKVHFDNLTDITKEMPYSFQVNSIADDVLDDAGHATAFKVGQKVTKALQNRVDVDVFKVTTPDTDSFYWFDFKNMSDSAVLYCTIFDNPELAGEPLLREKRYSKESGTHELGKLKRNYTYYVVVNHESFYDNFQGYPYEYAFSLTNKLDDVNNKINNGDDKFENITKLKIGTSMKRGIQGSDDVDYYQFTTTKDDNFYELTMDNTGEFAIAIEIWDNKDLAGQKVLDTSLHGNQSDTYNLRKLKKNHTYYVKVGKAVYHDFTKEAKYILKLKSTKDDVKDMLSAGKTIKLGSAANYGIQNTEDVDWFKFKTTGYTSYKINFANLSKSGSCNIKIYKSKVDVVQNIVLDRYCGGKQALDDYDAVLKGLKTNQTYYIKITGDGKLKYRLGVEAAGPSKSSVQKVSKKTRLCWSYVEKATGYEVFRSDKKNGTYKRVKTITKAKTLSYVEKKNKKLKKGKTYYYKVRAYKTIKGKRVSSGFSQVQKMKYTGK